MSDVPSTLPESLISVEGLRDFVANNWGWNALVVAVALLVAGLGGKIFNAIFNEYVKRFWVKWVHPDEIARAKAEVSRARAEIASVQEKAKIAASEIKSFFSNELHVLLSEFHKLRDEVNDLRFENAWLKAENTNLKAEIVELKAQLRAEAGLGIRGDGTSFRLNP
jgi:cell division protein FtsB